MFARGSLIYEVMSRAVDAEHKALLERPSRDIERKLFVSRPRATERRKKGLRRRKNETLDRRTRGAIYLHALLLRFGKSVTTPNELPEAACPEPLAAALCSLK